MSSVVDKDDKLVIGKITGSHGVSGEVKLKPYGEISGISLKSVFITRGSLTTPAVITKLKPFKDGFIAAITGVKTREDAHSLSGAFVSISKKDLPKPQGGEYYVHDLIGLEVCTYEGKRIGLVSQVLPTGGVDLLEVSGGEYGEVLIPLTADARAEVNLKEKKITLNVIDGLLDINKLPEKKSAPSGVAKTGRKERGNAK